MVVWQPEPQPAEHGWLSRSPLSTAGPTCRFYHRPVDTNDQWHQRARVHTPAGVHSNARLIGADTVLVRGDGPWLFDVEGDRHVDYMLGRGPAFLGHTPGAVTAAVCSAVASGLTLGSGTRFEVEASELTLEAIPWADQIRFTSSGTEAVQAAFRLARAATGRTKVVQFEGLYHGWIDSVSLRRGLSPDTALPDTGGQVGDSGANTLLVPWNDIAAVEATFERWGSEIAAVITEPVALFAGALPLPGYLERLRSLCDAHGTVLIFDEVVTGFRLARGSAAAVVGVEPDLATYAKAMGSGWPVSAVAGKGWLFDGVGADRVRLSGTYNGNTAAMAAVVATLQATADGSVHAKVDAYGSALMEQLVAEAGSGGVEVRCEGFPSAFWLVFPQLATRAASDVAAEELGLILRRHRVIQYHHTWLVSAAHDDEALAFTVAAFGLALRALAPFA